MRPFENIISFWFQGLKDPDVIQKNKPPVSLWFNGGRRFDEEIWGKFLEDYEKAKAGEYKSWEDSARGRLALVIIFDQFSRNMFRGTAQAFATDPLALELAQRSIKDGQDRELMLIERVFLYMTFMHAESLTVQDEGVRVFEALVEESKTKAAHNTGYFEYNLKYTRQHRDIIATFGRFPHRNAILKRASTPEEQAFLKSPGSSF